MTPPPPGPLSMRGPDFTATAEYQAGSVSAVLAGNADLQAKKGLDEFLSALHQTARTQAVGEVVVNFAGVTFMNSSCLKAFVTWICTVQDLPRPNQYQIVLVSSPEMLWQKRSLHALSCLAAELVQLR